MRLLINIMIVLLLTGCDQDNISLEAEEKSNLTTEDNSNLITKDSSNLITEDNSNLIVEDNIILNIRIHLMQSDPWIHPLGANMNMWVTQCHVRQTIIPEVNSIWSQANIEWKIESIINEPIHEHETFEEDIQYIINSERDENNVSDRARLPLLYELMDPSHRTPLSEIGGNLFHMYIFPFTGNTSQGNAMNPFGYHSVVGCWTNKHNRGGNPERTLLTEPHTEFVRGSLSRTISHELGHVLGLTHYCGSPGDTNCLMLARYLLNPEQINIATNEARRRSGI